MGRPKALLQDGAGVPFVVRAVRTLHMAGIRDVTVVTSPMLHDAVAQALAPDESMAAVVVNPDPDRGQLSSVWAGMDAQPDAIDGMVLALVDAPFASAATVRAIIEAHQRTRGAIVRPARGDEHGHPVIFDCALFAELRAADPAVGAKAVVRRHASRIVNVPIADEGAFVDVDTPEEYRDAVAAGR
jgi:molybdenum cofactor cytidylyltransferase